MKEGQDSESVEEINNYDLQQMTITIGIED